MPSADRARLRCAIYTRKSSEEGLEQDFNSLAAQREACEAYIRSQAHEGWQAIATRYDDGGYSGGTLERPALRDLLAAIKARKVDIVVIYKIDRLSRSLLDFAQLAELFDAQQVSFVSVTQSFNTTTSMGRLMLNVLLSFAQFEREITGERIRDKIAASKQKGLWMGGHVPLGYRAQGRTLVPEETEAKTVRTLFQLYLKHGCVRKVHEEATQLGLQTRQRTYTDGRVTGGKPFWRGHIYKILNSPLYIGRIPHKGQSYPGGHPGLVDAKTWESVQARLAANTLGHKTGRHARNPSLLAGLLVDADGAKFRATQGVKKGRTYRYYSHPAVVNGEKTENLPIRHAPANDVDDAVLAALDQLLADPVSLAAALGHDDTDPSTTTLRRASQDLRERLKGSPSDRIEVAQQLLPRVTLTPEALQLEVDRRGLRQRLGLPTPDTASRRETHEIEVPIRVRSRQGVLRLIFASTDRPPPPRVDRMLIQTLARAYRWWEEIEAGRYESIQAIAKAERLSGSYVTRVIRLAFLNPRIVTAIVRGEQPTNFSVRKIVNHRALPSAWESQRRQLNIRFDDQPTEF